MFVFILLIIIILILFCLNHKLLRQTKNLASDDELNKQTECLPSNEKICKEAQEMLGSTCEIQLDDKAKSSAYIYFLNKIILSNTEDSKKNFSRVMFIVHECIHSVQDKLTHKINFILANLKNVYDIVLLILILFGKGSWELILVSFLISFLSFYYRMILEADAVYCSVIVSRKYLEKRDMGNIADKYEEIVPKTVQGMYFSYILPILIRLSVIILIYIVL